MTAEEVTNVLNIFDELVDQNYGYEDNIGQDVQNNRIYEETARRYNELQQSKEQPVELDVSKKELLEWATEKIRTIANEKDDYHAGKRVAFKQLIDKINSL